MSVEIFHLPQNWRMNPGRLAGEGSTVFHYSSLTIAERNAQGGVDEVKIRRIDSTLFGFRLDLKGNSLSGIAHQFIDGLRKRNFRDQSIQKAAFEVSLMDHDLGIDFVDEVLQQYGEKDDLTMADRVIKMKELGFGRSDAGDWIFSVNGFRRDNQEDLMAVTALVKDIYGN